MTVAGRLPPFSLALLLGLALRPVPLAAIQPAAAAAFGAVLRRHPNLFDRLKERGRPIYLIEPIDLPFLFILDPAGDPPSLVATRDAQGIEPTATVAAPVRVLIDLLAGRIDGDSVFFSRELVIGGDTDAVLALNNTLDGAGIDLLGDVVALMGPLGRPAGRVVGGLAGLIARADADLARLQDAVIGPAVRRAESETTRRRALEDRVAALEKRVGRTRRANEVEAGP